MGGRIAGTRRWIARGVALALVTALPVIGAPSATADDETPATNLPAVSIATNPQGSALFLTADGIAVTTADDEVFNRTVVARTSDGADYSEAFDITDVTVLEVTSTGYGVVLVRNELDSTLYRWSPTDGLDRVITARNINDVDVSRSGVVVGMNADDWPIRPFRWTEADGLAYFPELAPDLFDPHMKAVDSDGRAYLQWAEWPDPGPATPHAFMWDADGSVVEIGDVHILRVTDDGGVLSQVFDHDPSLLRALLGWSAESPELVDLLEPLDAGFGRQASVVAVSSGWATGYYVST